jgi:hypothetical protein
MKMRYKVENDLRGMRFIAELEGELAKMDYRIQDQTFYMMHTFVPPSIEGKGVASSLIKEAITWALNEGFKIKVYCPFTRTYLKHHPEWEQKVQKALGEH